MPKVGKLKFIMKRPAGGAVVRASNRYVLVRWQPGKATRRTLLSHHQRKGEAHGALVKWLEAKHANNKMARPQSANLWKAWGMSQPKPVTEVAAVFDTDTGKKVPLPKSTRVRKH